MDPLKKLIDEVKAEGHKVFALKLPGRRYVYRTFTRDEYKEVRHSLEEPSRKLMEVVDEKSIQSLSESEKLLKLRELGESMDELSQVALVKAFCLNVPADMGKMPAGDIVALSNCIMEASGFQEEPEIEEL
jgi:hypothetical protein